MTYPIPNSLEKITSSSIGAVVYESEDNLPTGSFQVGTFESFETETDETNTLIQIKIIRVFRNDGSFTITVIEQTTAEIANYISTLNPIIEPITPTE